jgi:hypothetical protein
MRENNNHLHTNSFAQGLAHTECSVSVNYFVKYVEFVYKKLGYKVQFFLSSQVGPFISPAYYFMSKA